MDRRLAGTFATERAIATLTAAFAGLALLLASVGLYAVLAHSVAARTVEIGIRMAIGAERGALVRLVLWQGMRLIVAGIAAGLLAAAAAARAVSSQIYEIDPRNPWIYVLVAAVFAAVGIAASLAPALRASRVDPLTSLNAR
jgi:ABC-type antimicrobial peptide transport system permease subunit